MKNSKRKYQQSKKVRRLSQRERRGRSVSPLVRKTAKHNKASIQSSIKSPIVERESKLPAPAAAAELHLEMLYPSEGIQVHGRK